MEGTTASLSGVLIGKPRFGLRPLVFCCLLVVLLLVWRAPFSSKWTDSQEVTSSKLHMDKDHGEAMSLSVPFGSLDLTAGRDTHLAYAATNASGAAKKALIVKALEMQAKLEMTGLPQARDSLFQGLALALGTPDQDNLPDRKHLEANWKHTGPGASGEELAWVGPSITPYAFSDCTAKAGLSQNGEDKAIFEKYFKAPTIRRDGVFFEMGALDGWWLSNSYFFEQCLGWSGVLVEGHPDHFTKLKRHRTSPKTKRLWMGACEEDGGTLRFAKNPSEVSVALDQTSEEHKKEWSKAYGAGSLEIPCGPMGKYLELMGVNRIDFFSLDVEGAEEIVLRTIDWSKLSVRILMVEAMYTGPSPIRDYLLSVGFELEPEHTVINSAVFINRTFD